MLTAKSFNLNMENGKYIGILYLRGDHPGFLYFERFHIEMFIDEYNYLLYITFGFFFWTQ